MKSLRRVLVAVSLAAVLSSSTVVAQGIPPKVYWACQYYLFGMGPFMFRIFERYSDPSDYEYWTSTGWICQYVATCYYTQDIFGNVEEFCS